MKTRTQSSEGTRTRKTASTADSLDDFARVLRGCDLPNDELLARFKRAAPMLSWGGFELFAQAS